MLTPFQIGLMLGSAVESVSLSGIDYGLARGLWRGIDAANDKHLFDDASPIETRMTDEV